MDPMDFRVPMAPILAAFGVPATVTMPDAAPIETVGVWILPTMNDVPQGDPFTRRESRYLMALDRDAVPELPRFTLIEAPERLNGPVFEWTVDATDDGDPDQYRVILLKGAEVTS